MEEYPFLAQALSETIEVLRSDKRISKSALADFARLEPRYLREIAQGLKKPTVNAIYCICEALDITPAEFFRKVDEKIAALKS